ncbi:MAG: hypothetical protein R2753_00675 [Chitinophagales bacterium]
MRALIMAVVLLSCTLQNYAQRASILSEDILITVENEVALNSKHSEFGVNKWFNQLSFTTNRNQFSDRNEFIGDNSYDIYTYDETKKYRQVSPLETLRAKENIGHATQVVGDKFYYTAENNKADYNLKAATVQRTMIIYEASNKGDKWKVAPVKILRNKKYSCTHPSLSKNGKTLFFASDMPGGYGGMDLYVSHLVDNKWSKPVNLGPEINTAENELFPFIHDSGMLFFSSNGHKGFGGMDIFVTQFSDNQWQSPENMGSPVNTPSNDFSIYVDKNFTDGYFSSDREGGMGADDIYKLAFINQEIKKEMTSQNVIEEEIEVQKETLVATAPVIEESATTNALQVRK